MPRISEAINEEPAGKGVARDFGVRMDRLHLRELLLPDVWEETKEQ